MFEHPISAARYASTESNDHHTIGSGAPAGLAHLCPLSKNEWPPAAVASASVDHPDPLPYDRSFARIRDALALRAPIMAGRRPSVWLIARRLRLASDTFRVNATGAVLYATRAPWNRTFTAVCRSHCLSSNPALSARHYGVSRRSAVRAKPAHPSHLWASSGVLLHLRCRLSSLAKPYCSRGKRA